MATATVSVASVSRGVYPGTTRETVSRGDANDLTLEIGSFFRCDGNVAGGWRERERERNEKGGERERSKENGRREEEGGTRENKNVFGDVRDERKRINAAGGGREGRGKKRRDLCVRLHMRPRRTDEPTNERTNARTNAERPGYL